MGKPRRILIVDDDQDIKNIMVMFLKNINVECVLTTGASKALDILNKDANFKLIITDIVNPDMNGTAFIHHVTDFYSEIKILACSSGGTTESNGVSAEELFKKAVDNGADATLKKPFTKDQLCRAVTDLIGF